MTDAAVDSSPLSRLISFSLAVVIHLTEMIIRRSMGISIAIQLASHMDVLLLLLLKKRISFHSFCLPAEEEEEVGLIWYRLPLTLVGGLFLLEQRRTSFVRSFVR